jgi:hypothetical protein
MWSPTLVPKPKDWLDHIDIVGAFIEQAPNNNSEPVNSTETKKQFDSRTTDSEVLIKPLSEETATKAPSHPIVAVPPPLSSSSFLQENQYKMNKQAFDPTAAKTKSERNFLPRETAEYNPPADLADFLSSKDDQQPIIYVGFGSMVVKDLENIISLFLEAAAIMNTKILVQTGWTSLSPEKIQSLAAEAQEKARLFRETEEINSSDPSSLGGWFLDKIPPLANSFNMINSAVAEETFEQKVKRKKIKPCYTFV